jgi:DNA-binding IclR family transcriptional regulator
MQAKMTTHHSVEKALSILLAFTPRNHEKSATEIARSLGVHLSTSVRLLRILETHGFVYRDTATKRYSLGRSAFDIGRAMYQTARERIVVVAQPYVDRLRDDLGEDVGLEVLLNDRTVLAYRAFGFRPFSVEFTMGDSLPIHAVAGGKAMLAFSPPAFVESILKEGLPSLTPSTITDPQVFRERLSEYRKMGIAYDLGETDSDRHFVAAPIFGVDERPVAAVVIGAWAHKVKGGFGKRVIEALKRTAAEVSTRLRY